MAEVHTHVAGDGGWILNNLYIHREESGQRAHRFSFASYTRSTSDVFKRNQDGTFNNPLIRKDILLEVYAVLDRK